MSQSSPRNLPLAALLTAVFAGAATSTSAQDVSVVVLDGTQDRPQPIQDATVSIQAVQATTDANGKATLTSAPTGLQVLTIVSADGSRRTERTVTVPGSGTLAVPPILLNKSPAGIAAVVTLSSGVVQATTNVESSLVPDARLVLTATTTVTGANGNTPEFSIYPVSRALTPAPFSPSFQPSRLYVLHPVGLTFSAAQSVRIPNDENLAVSTQRPIFGYQASTGTWSQLGTATVDATGAYLESDAPCITTTTTVGIHSPSGLSTTDLELTVHSGGGTGLTTAQVIVEGIALAHQANGLYKTTGVAIHPLAPVRAQAHWTVGDLTLSVVSDPAVLSLAGLNHGDPVVLKLDVDGAAVAGGIAGNAGSDHSTHTLTHAGIAPIGSSGSPSVVGTRNTWVGFWNQVFVDSPQGPNLTVERLPSTTSGSRFGGRHVPVVLRVADADDAGATTAHVVSVEFSLDAGHNYSSAVVQAAEAGPFRAPGGAGNAYHVLWDRDGIGTETARLRITVEDESGQQAQVTTDDVHLEGPLAVIDVSPPSGSVDLFVDESTFVVTFDRPINTGTVAGNVYLVEETVGTVSSASIAYTSTTVTVNVLGAGLSPNTNYTLHVTTGVKDTAGGPLGVAVAAAFMSNALVSTLDQDLDGLTNWEERSYGTNPYEADTDGDGCNDWDEINVHGTDPLDPDTDHDGLLDCDPNETTPLGAAPDPPAHGATMAGAQIVRGDADGPLDAVHNFASWAPAPVTDIAILFPTAINQEQLNVEFRAPEGTTVFTNSTTLLGQFTQNHQLYLDTHKLLGQPGGDPTDHGTDLNKFKVESTTLFHVEPAGAHFFQGYNYSIPRGTTSVEIGRFKVWTKTLNGNSVTYTGQAPTQTIVMEQRDALNNLFATHNMGKLSVSGMKVGLWATVDDPRKIPGQSVTVEIYHGGQLLGTQVVGVVAPLASTGEHPELTETASLQGAEVNLESGGLRHDVSLFSAQGPGLPLGMDLQYHSTISGYWKALAPLPDRDEMINAPFGHGWTNVYTIRINREQWQERDTGGSVVNKTGEFTFQDANGRVVLLGTGATIQGLVGPGISPTFGVPYAEIDLEELAGGAGHKLTSKFSRIVATFDSSGRLTELRRKDHGRPVTLTYQANEIKITDSQMRSMTWTLANGLVTQVTDPQQRVWSFTYRGHSLTRIHGTQAGISYYFGYDPTSFHMSHATSPSGLVTKFEYRDPAASPDTGGPIDPRVTAYSVTSVSEFTAGTSFSHTRTSTGYTVASIDGVSRTATHEANTLSGGWYHWKSTKGDWSRDLDLLPDGTRAIAKVPSATGPTVERLRFTAGTHYQKRIYPAGESHVQLDTNGFWPLYTQPLGGTRVDFGITTQGSLVGLVNSSSWTGQAGLATTVYTHDSDGQVETVTDPRSVLTTLSRSQSDGYRGLVLSQTTSAGSPSTQVSQQFQYNLMGLVEKHFDSANVETDPEYNDRDQIKTISHAAGSQITYTYDAAGRVKTVSSNQGGLTTYVYDNENGAQGFGLLKSVTVDGVGTTTYYRNVMGEVTKVEGPRHQNGDTDYVEYGYDNRGLVNMVGHRASHAAVTPVISSTIALTYDARGNVKKRTRTTGGKVYETDYDYNTMDQLTQVQLPSVDQGGTWRPKILRTYDAEARPETVKREVAPGGGTPVVELLAEYEYLSSSSNQVVKVRRGQPSGVKAEVEYVYDVAGNLIQSKGEDFNVGGPLDPARPSSSVELDPLGRVYRVKDAAGNKLSEVIWDSSKGRVNEVWRPNSAGVLGKVEARVYDSLGRVESVSSLHGGKQVFTYDTVDRLQRVEIKTNTNALITRNDTTYDSLGRPYRVETRNDGGTMVRAKEVLFTDYGEVKEEIQVVGTNSYSTKYEYGAAGRPTKVTTPWNTANSPAATTFTYDAQNRLESRQTPRGVTYSYLYDEWDRVTREIPSGSGSTGSTGPVARTYDAASRLLTEENALYKRTISYDSFGRPTSIAVLDSSKSITRSFSLEYSTSAHRYGGLTKLTDHEGLQTAYSYDQELRLSQIVQTPSGGGATTVGTFLYDQLDRLTNWTTPGGSWTRVFDAAGFTTQQSSASPNHSITWDHDQFGRRISASYSHLNMTFNWKYDGLSRMYDEEVKRGDTPVYRDQFTYDDADNRTSRRRNGVLANYTYGIDGFNRLTQLEQYILELVTAPLTPTGDSELDANHTAALATDGTVSTQSGNGQSFVSGTSNAEHSLEVAAASALSLNAVELHLPTDVNFPQRLYLEYHDGTGWAPIPLLAVEGADLAMSGQNQDGVTPTQSQVTLRFSDLSTSKVRVRQPFGLGPIQPSTHGYALAISEVRLHSASTSSITNYGYDLNGNMTSAGSQGYSYDDHDRLSLVDDGAGVHIALEYGPNGQLMRQNNVNGSDERFLYLGSELYARYNSAGTSLTARYIQGPGLDRKIGVVPYVGTTPQNGKYFFSTPNGSVHKTVEVNSGSQVLLDTRVQSAFGEPILEGLAGATTTAPTEFGYTGRRRLGNSGLYDYRNRIYDPTLGRFLTPDPLGTEPGMNLYGYVDGDPVNQTDPFGLAPDLKDLLDYWPSLEDLRDGASDGATILADTFTGGAVPSLRAKRRAVEKNYTPAQRRALGFTANVAATAVQASPVGLAKKVLLKEVTKRQAAKVTAAVVGKAALHEASKDVAKRMRPEIRKMLRGAQNPTPHSAPGWFPAGLWQKVPPHLRDKILQVAEDAIIEALKQAIQGAGHGNLERTLSELSEGVGWGPYGHLKDGKSVGPGKNFTKAQKRRIIESNRLRNGGTVRSDDPLDQHLGPLKPPSKSMKGTSPPQDEWQFDHHIPKKNPVAPGSNSFKNARVLSRQRNRQKSNKVPGGT